MDRILENHIRRTYNVHIANESVRTGKQRPIHIPMPDTLFDKGWWISWLEFHGFKDITKPTIDDFDSMDKQGKTYFLGKYDGKPEHEWILVGDGKGTIYFFRTSDNSKYGNMCEKIQRISYGEWVTINCSFEFIRKSLEKTVK